MNSFNDSDDENKSLNTPPKKKQKTRVTSRRAQKFRDCWLQQENFGKWLILDSNNQYKAKCKVCDANFTAEVSVIRNHSQSHVHLFNMTKLSKQTLINTFTSSAKNTEDVSSKNTKRAEIKFCTFLVEHNLSFEVINHLTDLAKDCFPDSEIAKNMQLKSTKSKAIVKHVLGETQKEILSGKLKQWKFSVLVDESTDISATKAMCIVVRFYDEEKECVTSNFWDLCQIFNKNMDIEAATAENLFNFIKYSFEIRNVSLHNVIGFASDGCNTMMGSHNSVASRFRESYPGISIFKCICHSLHLCASEACKALPRGCKDLARNVYNYFKASAKRQSEFQEFLSFLDLEIHRVLHPAQTRWLSISAVVSRLVEQWNALDLYFTSKLVSDRLHSVNHIVHALKDPLIELHYLFLEWILPKFSTLNQLFQSEKPVISIVYKSITSIYKDLLKCYMNSDYVKKTDVCDLDPMKRDQFLPHSQIYLGVKVINYLSKPDINSNNNLKKDFYTNCVQFLSISCQELKKRFDFKDVVLQNMHIFNPGDAMSEKTRKFFPSLLPLMNKLPRIVLESEKQMIDDEWRKLPDFELPSHISVNDDIDFFWHKILNCGEGDQISFTFTYLAKFVLQLISLPHSNATCERIFSAINLVKTKTRNKLITPTVNGILLSKQRIDDTCVSFEPLNQDYNKLTNKVLYQKSKEKKSAGKVIENQTSSVGCRRIFASSDSESDDENHILIKNF